MKTAFWVWFIGAVVYLLVQLLDREADLSADERTPVLLKPVIAVFWFFCAPIQFFTRWKLKRLREQGPRL